MRDIDRISRTCAALEKLWEQFPDLRLTQLLSNFCILTTHANGDRLDYFQEDDVTYAKITYTLEQLESIEM